LIEIKGIIGELTERRRMPRKVLRKKVLLQNPHIFFMYTSLRAWRNCSSLDIRFES
jgi:hypothetical protein